MTNEFGSKLANSVRQAKEKKTEDKVEASAKAPAAAPAPSKAKAERPLAALSSNRVWPD